MVGGVGDGSIHTLSSDYWLTRSHGEEGKAASRCWKLGGGGGEGRGEVIAFYTIKKLKNTTKNKR